MCGLMNKINKIERLIDIDNRLTAVVGGAGWNR